MKWRLTRTGFTLVELLIVIIIVAVLAAIAIPKFSDSTLRSKESSLRAALQAVRLAQDRAEADTGLTFKVSDLDDASPPATGWKRGKMTVVWPSEPVPAGTWRGPYLSKIPINPFTNNNTYAVATGSSTTVAWTHFSHQTFNSSYVFYPSTEIGSDGRPYREW